MSYEEEQKKYKKELELIKTICDKYKKYFDQNPDKKKRINGYQTSFDFTRMQYEKILQSAYPSTNFYELSTPYLEYLVYRRRKSELEYNLKETKTHRNISRAIDYLGSITPQHVGGKVYQVENGDGCGTFCIWFLIIDLIFVLLFIMFNGH